MGRGILAAIRRAASNWWYAPRLLDQFLSLPDPEILELTDDMRLRPDPFGRFKRKIDALQG